MNMNLPNGLDLILERQFLKNDPCRKRAYICSPLSGETNEEVLANMRFARFCMLYAHERMNLLARAPHAYLPMLLCDRVPAERAARRMAESTGYPASTVHKALGLFAGEDGDYNAPNELEADLVLVDESSMLDIYLACHLFDALKPKTQIVFVGDADQLPSVGPGAVLSEMIGSGCIPTVRLDKVFRQNAGSRIAINAKLIRHGNVGLEYGEDFAFLDSPEIAESAEKIVELYLREIDRYGVDNVILLSPYRQKTETGVNVLNEVLREKVNPADRSKPEAICGKRVFRLGDKVMQTRNCEDINNGDIGYIRKIVSVGDDQTVSIDFGDGRVREYDRQDLEMLDLGYASTVHKSQGSEYQSVIINLQMAHSVMLTRPLIYTAITRGKSRVTVIGERRALCIAIKKTDTERRGTCPRTDGERVTERGDAALLPDRKVLRQNARGPDYIGPRRAQMACHKIRGRPDNSGCGKAHLRICRQAVGIKNQMGDDGMPSPGRSLYGTHTHGGYPALDRLAVSAAGEEQFLCAVPLL